MKEYTRNGNSKIETKNNEIIKWSDEGRQHENQPKQHMFSNDFNCCFAAAKVLLKMPVAKRNTFSHHHHHHLPIHPPLQLALSPLRSGCASAHPPISNVCFLTLIYLY